MAQSFNTNIGVCIIFSFL